MSDAQPGPEAASPPPAAPTNIAPMPKRAHHGKLSQVATLQDAFDHPDFINRIKQATPKHLSADRMLAVFVQSVQKTPKLRDVNMMSLLGAFLSVASVGLEPNTALQHAHLIPFEKKKWNPVTKKRETERIDVNVIFGYQGLLELAYRSGLLRSVHADVVWKADEFDFWYGSGGQLKHKPLGGTRAEGELPLWAYMHANMKAEGESFEVMPMSDVLAIRNSTQAYQSAMWALEDAQKKGWKLPASYTEAPWVKHFVPMARKTIFRAGSKWLPKSIELAAAVALDELQDRRSANFAGVIEGSADVLAGGLEALPDEATDRLDVGLGGSADSPAYSYQDDRPGRTQGWSDPSGQPTSPEHTAPQAGQTAAGPPGATNPASATGAQPSLPAFEAYLVDAEGEVAADLFTDPGLFAEAFLGLWGVDAAAHPALRENNAEALTAAAAFPEGADLARIASGEPDLAIMLVPGPRGPDITGWIKAAKEAIAALDAPTLPRWVAANEPTYRPFPASKRLEVSRAITERAKALGAPPPPQAGLPLASTAAEPKADPAPTLDDDAWAGEQGVLLGKAKTPDDVLALVERAKERMAQLNTSNPTVWRRVGNLFESRLDMLRNPDPGAEA